MNQKMQHEKSIQNNVGNKRRRCDLSTNNLALNCVTAKPFMHQSRHNSKSPAGGTDHVYSNACSVKSFNLFFPNPLQTKHKYYKWCKKPLFCNTCDATAEHSLQDQHFILKAQPSSQLISKP